MKDYCTLLSVLFLLLMKSKINLEVIKVLWSENAIEYFPLISLLLSSRDILYQSTCLHTPQQNGIAKKYRHLFEIVHTLLFGTNIHVHHWGDAILTTCFLIKKMPSSPNNEVPYSILFLKEPFFHISLRVCYLCFVHDMSPSLDKFSARAIKCLFFGIFSY